MIRVPNEREPMPGDPHPRGGNLRTSARFATCLAFVALAFAACEKSPRAPASARERGESEPPVAAPPTNVTAGRRPTPSLSCGPDPRVAWLEPQDRVCGPGNECGLLVSDACELLPMAAASGKRADVDGHRCRFTNDGGCACAVPGYETRCHEGCCQYRIIGAESWYP